MAAGVGDDLYFSSEDLGIVSWVFHLDSDPSYDPGRLIPHLLPPHNSSHRTHINLRGLLPHCGYFAHLCFHCP